MFTRAPLVNKATAPKNAAPARKAPDYFAQEETKDAAVPDYSYSLAGLRAIMGGEDEAGRGPLARLPIQAKLRVGAADDPLEREADRTADAVMRMSAQPVPSISQGLSVVRRKCNCGGTCEKCSTEQDEPLGQLRRKPAGSGPVPMMAPSIVLDVVRSPGLPLDLDTRRFMEPRFGRDLGHVRVHTDSHAAESARRVRARAYTVQEQIVFNGGQFAPSTFAGRRLLAHELTHVLQERKCSVASASIIRRDPDDKDPEPNPMPRYPVRVDPGTTALSRLAQEYRIDHPDISAERNVVAFSYSVGDGPAQTKVIANRPGTSGDPGIHSEHEMEAFLEKVRRDQRAPVTLHEVYSERQPCGPSKQDCEALFIRRYPKAKVTFGYDYQGPKEAPKVRAQEATKKIEVSQERLRKTKQLEWEFRDKKRTPPSHHERDIPGPLSKGPRGGGRGGGSKEKKSAAATPPRTTPTGGQKKGPSAQTAPKAESRPTLAPDPRTPEVPSNIRQKVGAVLEKGARVIGSASRIALTTLKLLEPAFALMNALEKVNQGLSALAGEGWTGRVRAARSLRTSISGVLEATRALHNSLAEMMKEAEAIDVATQYGYGADALNDFGIDAESAFEELLKNSRKLLDDVDETLNEVSAGQKLIEKVFDDEATFVTVGVSEYLPSLPWQSKVTLDDLFMVYRDFGDMSDILSGPQIELDEQVQVLEKDLQTIRATIVEQGLLGVRSYRTPGRK